MLTLHNRFVEALGFEPRTTVLKARYANHCVIPHYWNSMSESNARLLIESEVHYHYANGAISNLQYRWDSLRQAQDKHFDKLNTMLLALRSCFAVPMGLPSTSLRINFSPFASASQYRWDSNPYLPRGQRGALAFELRYLVGVVVFETTQLYNKGVTDPPSSPSLAHSRKSRPKFN